MQLFRIMAARCELFRKNQIPRHSFPADLLSPRFERYRRNPLQYCRRKAKPKRTNCLICFQRPALHLFMAQFRSIFGNRNRSSETRVVWRFIVTFKREGNKNPAPVQARPGHLFIRFPFRTCQSFSFLSLSFFLYLLSGNKSRIPERMKNAVETLACGLCFHSFQLMSQALIARFLTGWFLTR